MNFLKRLGYRVQKEFCVNNRKVLISVIGGHKCNEQVAELAEQVGKIIAEEGAILVTGGLAGVMEAASKGAKNAGGQTIGIIPGEKKEDANQFVDIVLTTGMGYSRNTLVAGSTDMVVAFSGSCGTLSEIGFALASKKPVYSFGRWNIEGVVELESAEEIREVIQKFIQKT